MRSSRSTAPNCNTVLNSSRRKLKFGDKQKYTLTQVKQTMLSSEQLFHKKNVDECKKKLSVDEPKVLPVLNKNLVTVLMCRNQLYLRLRYTEAKLPSIYCTYKTPQQNHCGIALKITSKFYSIGKLD